MHKGSFFGFMLKRFFFFSFLICLILCVFQMQRLIFLTDISTRPLTQKDTPELVKGDMARDPVYLVSYADGDEVFFQNQLALTASVLGRGVDMIMNYKRSFLDPLFVSQNQSILSQKYGAGYWLWKPWVILDAMKKAPENAIIIYSDGGSVIKNSVSDFIELTKKQDIVLCRYEDIMTYGTLKNRAKREVFIRLNCDDKEHHQHPTLWAGFLVLRNTPKARHFIATWLSYCTDPQLLCNEKSSQPEYPDFRGHLHDEAILGVVASLHTKDIQFVDYSDLICKYLVWHHRRKGTRPDEPLFIYRSLIPYYAFNRLMKHYESVFYNHYLLKWLRSKMSSFSTTH